jgi:hypothetical protein
MNLPLIKEQHIHAEYLNYIFKQPLRLDSASKFIR